MKRAQHEWIPGVPAAQGGMTIDALLAGRQSGRLPLPGSPRGVSQLGNQPNPFLAEGLIPIPGQPGVFWDPETGDFVDIRAGAFPLPGGGGGGAAAPQFRAGELEFLREQFEAEQEQFQLDLELRRLTQQQANAIAQGNLALAQQTEARIARIQQRQQQLEASLGRAQGIAGLASSRGNIEAQRAQFLSQLAANPRDFAQLNIGLGGGQGFLGQLLNRQPVGGQSTSLIGQTPTLGADFQRLLQSITARPDVPLFEEAADLFRNVPQFRKGGTHMVTDEPILGIGLLSGLPKFTLGEPAPGFPRGKPEDVEFSADGRRMKVTPLAHGGQVTAPGQGFNPFGPGTTIEDILAGAGIGGGQPPAPPPAAPKPPAQQPFTLPDFPGIGALLGFLFEGSGLQQTIGSFGQGTSAGDIGTAAQEFQRSIPRTPGDAIRRLMSGLGPQQFHGLLPSQLGLLESVISALGVPPQDFFSSLTRSFPTGPDPSRISFGNFDQGGSVTYVPAVQWPS